MRKLFYFTKLNMSRRVIITRNAKRPPSAINLRPVARTIMAHRAHFAPVLYVWCVYLEISSHGDIYCLRPYFDCAIADAP